VYKLPKGKWNYSPAVMNGTNTLGSGVDRHYGKYPDGRSTLNVYTIYADSTW